MYISTSKHTHLSHDANFSLRRIILLTVMVSAMGLLGIRAINLQVVKKHFLQQQGEKRHVRTVSEPAYRGKIVDRHGEILAISSPVQSIWVNPRELDRSQTDKLLHLIDLLNLSASKAQSLLQEKSTRQFLYLKRRISPVLAKKIMGLDITGVYSQREFKRFYPTGQMTAHTIGFTDIDDNGQAGLEFVYQKTLEGLSGSKRVIRDGKRRIIEDIENVREPVTGKDLVLSIDKRVQYLAYRELQKAFLKHQAKSAALVVLDAKTGEVLASVTQPSFNPNSRKNLKSYLYRNRAVTDVFEPGSTVKPFVIAAALDAGYVNEKTEIETGKDFQIGHNWVRDVRNYGTISLMKILKKSSNVGTSKVALKLPNEYLWNVYDQLGFGRTANVYFPGEASGSLLALQNWDDFSKATLSFGYGLSTSTLQLARAYTALADNGLLHSVSLIKRDQDYEAQRIFKPETATKVREMLEHVVRVGGTATRAKVNGYRVAGKTGTVKKADAGGYTEDAYFSVFAGIAPASKPRFVMVVMVDEPTKHHYYGGLVAAPVFAKVMTGILRIYGIEPDQEDSMPILLTRDKK